MVWTRGTRMRLFAAILEQVCGAKAENEPASGSVIADKEKRTTLVGLEIAEGYELKLIVDEVTFNSLGGVPKGHPFIDREWKGALKVTKDTIETPIDLTKDMSKEELTKYVEREWNRGKYQAGKK